MDKQLDLATSSIKAVLETLSTDTSFSSIGDKKKASAATGGLSLLDLKNEALLSYLHNSVLVLLGKLERGCNGDVDNKKLEELEQKAVRNTVTQRVVLEKGVRGLESKVSYQVEKALRAYARSKAEAEEKGKKLAEQKDDEEDDDEDDEENGDLLMFKPNPKLLLNNNKPTAAGADKPKSKRHRDSDSEDDDEPKASTEKYQVPKISAVSQQQAHPDAGPNPRANKRQVKNALMEDYLEATSAAPVAEPSIGSTILDHGRGGIKSARDRRKEKEIRDYEETNYTRLTSVQKKEQSKKKKGGRHDFSNDSFFGEDWGFSSKSNVDSATKKRRSGGATSVWDKTKKRRR
jgi:U3 small nucleolar ribonucleoprotein protein LCP5